MVNDKYGVDDPWERNLRYYEKADKKKLTKDLNETGDPEIENQIEDLDTREKTAMIPAYGG